MLSVSFRLEVAIVALLLVVAGGFGLYHLSESPPVWYDEGFYMQTALSVMNTGSQSLQVAPGVHESVQFVTVGFPLIYPLAAVFKVFGVGVFQARVVVVLFLLGFLVVSYAFMRSLVGVPVALVALALVATFPPLYGNGKSVLGEVPGLMLLMLALLSVVWLERSHFTSLRAYALSGFFAGLAIATKPLFILIAPAGLVALLIVRRQLSLDVRGVLLCVFCGIVPLVVWFFTQFHVGDSLGSVLAYYANPYGYSDVATLVVSNAWRFFSEATPLYALVVAALWIASIAVRVWRDVRITLAEWVAVLFCVTVFLAYLRTPGWYRYFFPAHTIAVLFAPLAVVALYEWVTTLSVASGRLYIRAAGLLCVALLVLHLYQLTFSSWVAVSYNSTRSADLAHLFASLPATPIFLYDAPELVVFLNSNNYYQYLHPAFGSVEIGKAQLIRLRNPAPLFVLVKSDDVARVMEMAPFRTLKKVGGYQLLTNAPN